MWVCLVWMKTYYAVLEMAVYWGPAPVLWPMKRVDTPSVHRPGEQTQERKLQFIRWVYKRVDSFLSRTSFSGPRSLGLVAGREMSCCGLQWQMRRWYILHRAWRGAQMNSVYRLWRAPPTMSWNYLSTFFYAFCAFLFLIYPSVVKLYLEYFSILLDSLQ